MNITRKNWIVLGVCAIIGAIIWLNFSLPRYTAIDLTVDRHKALEISKDFLKTDIGINPEEYQTATIFFFDRHSDRYLQKAMGFEKAQEYLAENDYEFFFWITRFYKEKEKDGFRVIVSCKTGEVTSFTRSVEQTKEARSLTRDEAMVLGKETLQKRFGIDFDDYVVQGDLSRGREFRTDYTFSWEKKDAAVAWSDNKKGGKAQLMTGITIGGDEVITFSKFSLRVPEGFNRYLAEQTSLGQNLSTLIRILQILIFVGAIFYIVIRINHLAMHTTKMFYIGFVGFVILLNILSELNLYQHTLMSYDSTQPIKDYFTRYIINSLVHIFFMTIGIIMPALAGESLHYEMFKNKRQGRMLYYLRTSFLTRDVFYRIGLGYLVCISLIGMQSLAVHIGQTYWGVWVENTWITQLSSTYVPFFAAFVLGFKASAFEEIIFRLFSISWFKKLFKSTIAAVVISALIWGFSHSGYLVFPMWFRGVEVSILGLVFGYVFLRFGFIPVLVAHYAFDTFWASSGYLFGKSDPIYFWSSLGVIFLPLALGVIAFIANRPAQLEPLRWKLSKAQAFNLEVLKNYLNNPANRPAEDAGELKKKVVKNGWDVAVVETALEDLNISRPEDD